MKYTQNIPFIGLSIFIINPRKGYNPQLITIIIKANIPYAFLYNCTNANIFSLLFSANGLYKLYTILIPIPPSINIIIESTFVNNPFTPKYSSPKLLINTFLDKKPNNIITTCENILIDIFLIAYFVLIILSPSF